MLHDLRDNLRMLARRPGFSAAAVLSLALGLGGTSLIIGLVDGLVLRPFALPDPDRLVTVSVSFPRSGGVARVVEVLSPPEYADISRLRTLTHVQAFDLGNRHVSGGDQPERLFTALVLGDLFPTVGLRPILGRGFTADELAQGGRRAAVLSHRIWRSRFGGDPAIVGRAIRVNGVATTVVGVMPPELLVLGTDLWLPLGASSDAFPRNQRNFTLLARLAPGATLTQVNAELDALASRTNAAFGAELREYDGWRLVAMPWARALTQSIQPVAWVLLGAVGFLLLIVCVNVASLQLVRASTRQRELAVRVTLGAGHWRVGRQLLYESLLLAAAGGALGLAVAAAGLRAAKALLPAQLAAVDPHVGFSGRLLLASLVVTAVAGVLVGVLPALRAMRTDPYDALKRDARHATPHAASQRLRHALIVAEIAFAMILLAGAGLLTRTMVRLSTVHPGVDVENVITMRLTLPRETYQGPAIGAFFERLIERVQSVPGVRTAGVASQFPPDIFAANALRFEGRVPAGGAGAGVAQADLTIASPDLFRTLGVALRAGRGFAPTDDAGAPQVAIVNESFARRYYRDRSPLGQRVAFGSEAEAAAAAKAAAKAAARANPNAASPWIAIVGVVADTHGRGVMQEPRPEVYIPMRQMPSAWNQLFLLVRAEGDPRALLPAIRREVTTIDRDQPVYGIRTLEEAFNASLFAQRTLMQLLVLFAALAALLAAMGIYAVMSHAVGMRRQEIGVRLALGARAGTVVAMVIRQVLGLTALGIALGLAGALALGGLLTSVLAGTTPTDPLTLTIVVLLLASVALFAAWLPARRASRIDPVVALRVE